MSKLNKFQNINKTVEETALELDGEMSMDTELVGKFITQQVAVDMDKKTNSMKIRLKTRKGWKIQSVGRVIPQKWYEGRWTGLQEKENIPDSNKHQVKTTSDICVSIGTRLKEHSSKPLERKIPKIR